MLPLFLLSYNTKNNFSQKGNLKRHVASVHEGKKPFKCKVCDYKSSRQGNLNQNIISVHDEKKPFKCEVCDYSCSLKEKSQNSEF